MPTRRLTGIRRHLDALACALAMLAAAWALALPGPLAGSPAPTPATEQVAVKSLDRSISEPVPGFLYRPDGPGPFPAVVLLHACGGITKAHLEWAAWFQRAGYVALVLDSMAPRGATNVCGGGRPTPYDQALDGYGGLAYLRSRPEVSPDRVAVMGWSHGGGAVLQATSDRLANQIKPSGGPFSAGIALYPICVSFQPGGIASPLLLLVGGRDDWQPPASCLARAAELKNGGAPIAWHLYPEATHAFDANAPDHTVKVGNRTYHLRYDPDAAQDAHTRVSEFLAGPSL